MKIESLEIRRLLTVTVTENYYGFYQIDGDSSKDTIEVSVSQSDQSFTLNGTTYSDAYYISVFGNGGNDVISLISQDTPGNIGAGIDGGDGNDTITLNFDGSIYAGAGNDTVELRDSFRGEVYGGDGNDQMLVSGTSVYAQIEGNDGNDYIDCSNNDYSVTIHGGAGNDTLIGSEHDDEIYGDEGSNSVDGRGGNDTFYCQFSSNDTVVGGSGFDVLRTGGGEASVSGVEQTV
jgi:hypothetical protein